MVTNYYRCSKYCLCRIFIDIRQSYSMVADSFVEIVARSVRKCRILRRQGPVVKGRDAEKSTEDEL